jgi:hypothetical protein
MQIALKLEYLGGLVLACFLLSQLHYPWWLFAALFLTPDIGMLSYVINPKVGAATYNTFHHFGLAVVFYIVGSVVHMPILQLVGTVMIGHLSFDRVVGYGLKYADSFKHTHIGELK